MGRGILSGLIWGLIVGGGIIVLSNVLVEPRQVIVDTPVPQGETQSPSDGSQIPQEDHAPELSAEMPAAEPNRSGAQPGAMTEPQADAPLNASDTPAAPAPQSETEAPARGDVEAAPADPLPQVDGGGELPVLPAPQASEPRVDAAPGAAPQPLDDLDEGTLAPLPDGTDVVPDQPAQPEAEGVDTTSDMPTESGAADGNVSTDMDTGGGSDALMEGEEEPQSSATAIGTPAASLGTQVGSFTDREDDRISSRLPTVTSAQDAPLVMADDLPALLAYSADFDPARVVGPAMSIILVDIGELGPQDAAISQLPFPVTFGVDVLADDAAQRARAYRDKGLEVLAMVGLPEGATPQDAAVILDNARATMPVSIGFLDVPSASYQMSRQVAAQVVAVAQGSGHALVTFPRGLNALEQEAKRAGDHPAVLVFRDFDGRGQDIAAMKRFIDQAAFRAGKDEHIVLVGRAKPDTIQALAEWALGNRAASVSLVPLSYLLTAETDSE